MRIRGALENSGFKLPPRRITVNLAPADLRKDGAAFDVPIAVGMLAAAGVVDRGGARAERCSSASWRSTARCGRVRGVLPMARSARARGARGAGRAARERRRGGGGRRACRCSAPPNLSEVVGAAARRAGDAARRAPSTAAPRVAGERRRPRPTCAARRSPRRALEIAAAGGHNLLFVGPPGVGQDACSARRLPGILPPLDVRRGAGDDDGLLGGRPARRRGAAWRARPFRAPHHTVSVGRAGRRRADGAAGRDLARAQRRAVPRRAARVPAPGAGGAAPAARGARASRSCARAGGVTYPARLHAGRGAEPLPVRPPRQHAAHLHLLGGGDRGATGRGSRGRCSIASTCTSRSRASPYRELRAGGAGRVRAPPCATRVVAARERQRRRAARALQRASCRRAELRRRRAARRRGHRAAGARASSGSGLSARAITASAAWRAPSPTSTAAPRSRRRTSPRRSQYRVLDRSRVEALTT